MVNPDLENPTYPQHTQKNVKEQQLIENEKNIKTEI